MIRPCSIGSTPFQFHPIRSGPFFSDPICSDPIRPNPCRAESVLHRHSCCTRTHTLFPTHATHQTDARQSEPGNRRVLPSQRQLPPPLDPLKPVFSGRPVSRARREDKPAVPVCRHVDNSTIQASCRSRSASRPAEAGASGWHNRGDVCVSPGH
ncbi:unnamed protein product [Protopolystoma xenopodis]|uniref:Uncharacterized protein n=1 Tax=Protopolystoma xenopodis TaxID=117903 RepID=A0A3S5APC9_9PLAT|nr:unnamed protein product [Protopolystoma xenopodis]